MCLLMSAWKLVVWARRQARAQAEPKTAELLFAENRGLGIAFGAQAALYDMVVCLLLLMEPTAVFCKPDCYSS